MKKNKSKAIALQYDGRGAPRVTAKGEGELAKQIIKTALIHKIPLQEDSKLIELLAKIELNKEIPQELYYAVAQLLVFIYFLEEKQNLNTIEN